MFEQFLPSILILTVGFNLYLYTNSDSYFNLIVGSLNIGVWVFNRNVERGLEYDIC